MATEIKSRRGTEAQHDDGTGFTGAEGELTVDTTNDTVRVHDGSTKGGHRLAKYTEVQASNELSEMLDVNLTSPADGSLLKYDNASSKWIDSSKLTETGAGINVTGTVAASDGLTADYIDLTGGKSTTSTGAICADQIRFSAEGTDEAKIYASVDGLNTSLFIQSNDDGTDKVRVVAGGTESLTVSKTGIDVTGTVTADLLTLHPTGGASEGGQINFQRDVDDSNAWYVDVFGATTDTKMRFVNVDDGLSRLEISDSGIDVTGTVTADGVALGNNERITLGGESAGKLEIYEATGGNGVIEQTGAGALVIKGQNGSLRNDANANLIAWDNATAELYHRNGDNEGLKLQTTNNGIDVTGTVTADKVKLGNGEFIELGNNSELKLHFNGTDSYIAETGSGNLRIAADDFRVQNGNATVTLIQANEGGSTALHWGGGTNTGVKLETKQSGVDISGSLDVTGTVTADGVKLGDNDKLQFGNVTTPDLEIYHNGSHSVIEDVGTGNLVIRGANIELKNANNKNKIFIHNGDDGSVKISHGNDEAATLETTATGIDVTGTVAASDGLTADYIDLTGGESTTTTGTVACSKIKLADPSTPQNDEHLIYTEADSVGSPLTNLVIHAGDDTHEKVILRVGNNNGGHIDALKATGSGVDIASSLDVTGTVECKDTVAISTTGSGTDPSPDLDFINLHADAVGERLGQINYYGMNDESGSGSGQSKYAWTEVRTIDVTEDFEKAQHETWVKNGANHTKVLTVAPTGIDVTGTVDCDTLTTGDTTINGNLEVKSTTADGNFLPEIRLKRDGGGDAGDDGDVLGALVFEGDNRYGVQKDYARIGVSIKDDGTGVTDGRVKGEIRFACADGTASPTLEQPSFSIDSTGVHINSDTNDGTSNSNYYHVDNVNLAGVLSGGIKFNSRTESEAANKTTTIKCNTITEDHSIILPNSSGTVVLSSIAGGSINGGGDTTAARTTWTEAQYTANPNSTYLHFNTNNTTNLVVTPELPLSGFGEFFKFVNASPVSGSKIEIDVDGYSQSNVAIYAFTKTDGSVNEYKNTTEISTITIDAGGFVVLTKVSLTAYLVEGIGYSYA